MSAFDKFCQEVVAMEGIVSKFKNRRIQLTERAKKAPKFRSVKDLINSEQDGGHRVGLIDGICVDLYIEGDGSPLIPADYHKIGLALTQVAAAHKALCKAIVDDYNESQGKKGPWEWTEGKQAEFSKKSISDVSSKIKLSMAEVRYYDHSTPDGGKYNPGDIIVDLWFDDGDLWWGHVIIMIDAVDRATGKTVTSNIRYEIAG